MAAPVLSHRMALTFAARARGIELRSVISEAAETVTRAEAAA
jgi:MoxR-like ATPase